MVTRKEQNPTLSLPMTRTSPIARFYEIVHRLYQFSIFTCCGLYQTAEMRLQNRKLLY